ncbi:Glycosyltransferase involved in cell wall bisynthesis [Paenibacillus sp. yr247]|uniref:glycosyltransferase family 4 protein n=1 Tax=Paenibacillus sp. yr247 TaxID=1761880 RepID=UPI000883AB52|nr:glycosyltransferase family 4 protein [Paenibacillus sp. yr247]SDN60402.1 Glycosyltransferase involved in cell wall bisynthesis [Paenibacillus sp. yr247]
MSQRSMRVVIVTPGSFPVPSGISSSVEQVVQKTAEHLVKRMPVYVLGRKTSYQPMREVRGGSTYIRVRYESPLSYISAISQQIANLKPAIIQVENRPHFVRYLRKRYPRCVISLVLHSNLFISKPHISSKQLTECLAATDVIIVNSDYLKQSVRDKVPSVAHKIVTQHLGVDVSRFTSRWSPEGSESRRKLLQKLGYENRKIILFVGRLIPKKGVHHLLKAMQTIIETEPNTVLVLVGSAFYGSRRLTEYVKRLYREGSTMPQHVRFIPYVSHLDIPKWYHIADVVTVPSEEGEAFGLVNVEAMASGIPVVATRSGGIQEVIADGTVGYLIDFEGLEADLPRYLLRLLENEELRRAMGELGIQRVNQLFTWEKAAEVRYDLYKSMLGK